MALTMKHSGSLNVMMQMVFEQLFNETLIHTGSKAASISAASASQLRYLVLRNLANLLAGEDVSAPRALSFYAQALMLDNGDSVVWNHMGTLVTFCYRLRFPGQIASSMCRLPTCVTIFQCIHAHTSAYLHATGVLLSEARLVLLSHLAYAGGRAGPLGSGKDGV